MTDSEENLIAGSSKPFLLEDWEVDPAGLRVSRGGESTKLEPRTMAVLVYLAEHAGETVTREQLEAELWTGMVVGYDAVSSAIAKLRKALADDERKLIETLPKTGYRLTATVSEVIAADDSGEATQTGTPAALVSSQRNIRVVVNVALILIALLVLWYYNQPKLEVTPTAQPTSIAVLPFRDITASERSALLGDGIGESIVTALAKIPQLFVISRRTSFAFKESTMTIQQIGEALKARYVLEGSIQLMDDNLRITAQCVNTEDGHHVWAQQYDRTLANIFEIQDDITRNVAEALEIELAEGEQARYRQGQTDNVAAYEDFLQGLQHYRRFTPTDNDKAASYFEQAMEKDPGFLHARAEVGWAELNRWRFRWGSEPKRSLERARELAQAVLQNDPNHSTANALLGTIYRYEKRFNLAIEHGQRSVKTEPSGADITATLATTYLYAGESDMAMNLIERAIQLSPKHPSWYFYTLGAIQRELGQYDEAVASHEQWRKRNTKSPNPHLALIYSYTLADRLEEARTAAAEVLRRQPKFSVTKWIKHAGFKDPETVNKIAAAMRLAGLPD